MITKQHSFKLPNSTIYGIAGGAFILVTVGLMLKSQFAAETYAACGERYAKAGMFALERSSGALLTATELQSKLAGREWGVLHNIAVKPEQDARQNVAMTVKFKAGGKIDRATRRSASGVGFKWQPSYLKKTKAACLSYSIRLPEKFDFADGGTLPGLFGANPTAAPDAPEEFSFRMRWLPDARLGIQPVTAKRNPRRTTLIDGQWLELPRGRWINIEQEVVLNTPGQSDGVLRVWVDHELRLNLKNLTFRRDPKSSFNGVIADTHYANSAMGWAPAPKATEIKLSPMIVRWN